MTNQEKKAWLLQYRRLHARIDRMEREKSRWIERATQISATSDGMPHGSGVSDRVGNTAAKIADLTAEINREIDRLVDLRREIEKTISAVQDDTLRELLRFRYIDGRTFEEVAVRMHYSYQWVCILHGRALSGIKTLDSN